MRKRLLITVLTVVLLVGAAVSFLAPDTDPRTESNCHGPAPSGSGTLKWMYIPEREAGAPEWTASAEWVCAVDQTPPTPVPVPEPEVETVEVTPEPTPDAELSTKGASPPESTTTKQASTAPKQAPDPPGPTPTATPNPECEGVKHMTFDTYAEQGFTYEEWSAYRKGPCFLPAASQ